MRQGDGMQSKAAEEEISCYKCRTQRTVQKLRTVWTASSHLSNLERSSDDNYTLDTMTTLAPFTVVQHWQQNVTRHGGIQLTMT